MIGCRTFTRTVILCGLVLTGCSKPDSSTPTNSSTAPAGSSSKSTATTGDVAKPKDNSGFWEDYPDIPKVEILTEIDGIKIPRAKTSKDTLELAGPIPADVGNEHAKQKPSQPATGDTVTIRFNAEPKSLNPMTETSAYMTYIIKPYVHEFLAPQNNETFKFEPGIAYKWIVEDSVKLSADYPGHERRVALGDGTGQTSVEFDYVTPEPKSDKATEPKILAIRTTDRTGQPVGNTWVGIFPVGQIVGASATGYHYWTNAEGQLELKDASLPTGKYQIKTGDELFGESKPQDSSLVVTPASPENPLKEPITLQAGEWQDVQAKTYGTLYLRDDVKWSDGAPYTTKDIEFCYALMNNASVDGDTVRTYYDNVVECKALGPHSIRMRYRQQYFAAQDWWFQISFYGPPFHFFHNIFREQGRELTFERLTPAEEAAQKKISVHGQEFGKFFNTDERYNSKPLGTGPYIVDKWERKDRVELIRNPNYWNPEKAGHLDRIIFKFIPDSVTAFTALRTGAIDFFYDMETTQYFDDWSTLDEDLKSQFVKSSWFIPVYQWVGWNQLAGPLKDRRVRLALSMLFNKQEFINEKMNGAAVMVSGSGYIFGPSYDPEVAPIGYDPETARELLSEAGWIDTDNDGILDRNGEKFELLMQIPQGRPIYPQICEVMQKNYKSVGISLQIRQLEWASFVDKLKSKECDVVMLRWVMDPESDPYQIWHSSGAARENRGSNSVSFSNKRADELIELIRVTLDDEKRYRLHKSFHRVIDSEQPYMFLWTPKLFGAYHKRIRNVKWYRLRPGFDMTDWYVPKDEQLYK